MIYVNNSIEMFGLPGAGKTTLQKCLADGDAQGLKILVPSSIGLMKSCYHATLLLLRMLLFTPKHTMSFVLDKQSRRLLLKLGLRAGGHKKQDVRDDRKVLMKDSGVIMPIVSALVEDDWDGTEIWIRILLANVVLPSTAILIDVEPAVSHWRYHERNKGSQQKDIKCFYRAHRLLDYMVSELISNGVNVIAMKNDRDARCSDFISIIETVIQ